MWRVDGNTTGNASAALATLGITGVVVMVECVHLGLAKEFSSCCITS